MENDLDTFGAERRRNERRRFGPPTHGRSKPTWFWLTNTTIS